jgi:hypothetical protein
MSGGWLQVLLAILLIAFPALFSTASEPSQGIEPSLVIEEFDVFNDGDMLLVPVDIGGKKRIFLVDTGYSVSTYDASLRSFLGNAKGTTRMATPSGSAAVDLYDAPDVRLGKLRFRSRSPVGCLDFQKLRKVSGHDFYGVIGMDVLGDQVIRLDSDHGKLMFLRSPGKTLGEPLSLAYSLKSPLATIDIPSLGKRQFMIDTGVISRDSGMIDARTFEYLAIGGVRSDSATSLFTDLTRTATSRQAHLETVHLGTFECRRIVMGQLKERRLLSARFLTRFNITFDFSYGRLYLEKSKHFDRPDRWDLSGLHFLRLNGDMVVEAVDEDSTAASCGIESGDIVLSVNGEAASKARLFVVRETLSIPGTTVRLRLKRGDEIFEADLKLPEAMVVAESAVSTMK